MKKKDMIERLRTALKNLPEGKGVDLGEDTFLVEGGLDGSDKCYGFVRREGELLVITREASDGYPIADMDKRDLDYMFGQSPVIDKIEKGKYETVEADFL